MRNTICTRQQRTALAFSDIWLQIKRACIDRDIVFACSVQFGVCCCTNFPFHLFSESRPFHHLFSLFLVQHLSISPCLFISLPGCACKSGRVHWSGLLFTKSCLSFCVLFYVFYGCLVLVIHCCSDACFSQVRRFLSGFKFKKDITS